jgi:hypothetical protein
MRTAFVSGNLAILVALLIPSLVAADSNDSQPQPALRSAFLGPDAWGDHSLTRVEISQQLQQHFGKVLQILNDQSESSLKEAVALLEKNHGPFNQAKAKSVYLTLAKRRIWQMRTLSEYAQRGKFPQNEDHGESAVPIFVDNHQTHCAVGYLMHRSGHDSAVANVVRTNNLVHVNEVASGPLVDWIKFSGLTQQEAAMFQPAYETPAFDAMLSDFSDSNFSYSENGVTISDLSVSQHSFLSGSNDFDAIFAQGVSGVNTAGIEYANPNSYGIALGTGPWNGDCFGCDYTPGFDNWMFMSGNYDTPEPDAGDDAIMYRIDVKIQTIGDPFQFISTGVSGNFDPNGISDPEAYLRLVTEAYDDHVNFLDSGSIDAEFGDSYLIGTTFMRTADENELLITNFALDVGNTNFVDGYQSHWHGFAFAVPEPSSSTIIVLTAFCIAGRRRR